MAVFEQKVKPDAGAKGRPSTSARSPLSGFGSQVRPIRRQQASLPVNRGARAGDGGWAVIQRVGSGDRASLKKKYKERTGKDFYGGYLLEYLKEKKQGNLKLEEAVDYLVANRKEVDHYVEFKMNQARGDTSASAAASFPPPPDILEQEGFGTWQVDGSVASATLRIRSRPRESAEAKTLVLFAHGAQGGEADMDPHTFEPRRNFAYLVKNHTAMSRATSDHSLIGRYASQYDHMVRSGTEFAMEQVPPIFVGPHDHKEISELLPFAEKVPGNIDVAFLSDVRFKETEYQEYSRNDRMPLAELLLRVGDDGSLLEKYDSFLLAICRSPWPITGLGGAGRASVPNGLYTTFGDEAVSRALVPVVPGPERRAPVPLVLMRYVMGWLRTITFIDLTATNHAPDLAALVIMLEERRMLPVLRRLRIRECDLLPEVKDRLLQIGICVEVLLENPQESHGIISRTVSSERPS